MSAAAGPSDEIVELRYPLYERRWVCQVFTSGFHNGCHCTPQEPHHGWDCGPMWVASRLPDTPEVRALVERIEWFRQEALSGAIAEGAD